MAKLNLRITVDHDQLMVVGPNGPDETFELDEGMWVECTADANLERWVLGMKHDLLTPFKGRQRLLSASGGQADAARVAAGAEGVYDFFALAYGGGRSWHVDPKLVVHNPSGGITREVRALLQDLDDVVDSARMTHELTAAAHTAFQAAVERHNVSEFVTALAAMEERASQLHQDALRLQAEFEAQFM